MLMILYEPLKFVNKSLADFGIGKAMSKFADEKLSISQYEHLSLLPDSVRVPAHSHATCDGHSRPHVQIVDYLLLEGTPT